MYYKVISGGRIIDACDGLSYVKRQQKNGVFLSCDAKEAIGFISSDGSKVYILDGNDQIEGILTVTVSEITQEQYEALLEELAEYGAIEEELEPDPEPEPEAETENRTALQILNGRILLAARYAEV